MKIEFTAPTQPETGTHVVGALEEGVLTPSAEELDGRLGGALRRAIAASRFTGKARQMLDVVAPAGIAAERVLPVGLGKPADLDQRAAEDLGGAIYGHVAMSGVRRAAVTLRPVEIGRESCREIVLQYLWSSVFC